MPWVCPWRPRRLVRPGFFFLGPLFIRAALRGHRCQRINLSNYVFKKVRVVSKVISKILSLWSDLKEKDARDEYVSSRIDVDLSHQIFSLRTARDWTQGELALRCGYGNSQGRISKLENSCEGVSVATLKRIASALDVAVSIKFVPFSQIVAEEIEERLDRTVPSFDADSPPDAIAMNPVLSPYLY